jgi:hypothetical protein
MRKITILICLLAMSYPVTASAVVGLGLGGKVGYANYTGDILPSSGDVGSGPMFGAVLEVSTFPVVDLELHAGYFSKDFEYQYNIAGVPTTTQFQFQDFHVLAMAKKNLIALPGSPLGLYVGGGLGWHLINTEVAKGFSYDSTVADNPVALFANSAKMSYNGLVGAKISPPLFPLAIFGEARYGRIFTDEQISTTEIEAGLMMKF